MPPRPTEFDHRRCHTRYHARSSDAGAVRSARYPPPEDDPVGTDRTCATTSWSSAERRFAQGWRTDGRQRGRWVTGATFAGAVGCADTKGNACGVVADTNTGNGTLFVCSTTVVSTLVTGDSVTATYAGFNGRSVIRVNDITNLAGHGTFDRTSVNSGINANPSSGTITTNQSTKILGVVSNNSVATFSPRPGFTIVGAITSDRAPVLGR